MFQLRLGEEDGSGHKERGDQERSASLSASGGERCEGEVAETQGRGNRGGGKGAEERGDGRDCKVTQNSLKKIFQKKPNKPLTGAQGVWYTILADGGFPLKYFEIFRHTSWETPFPSGLSIAQSLRAM